MPNTKLDSEIVALLQLVDDPDQEVFEVVSQKLLGYGASVIPHLEQFWEFSDSDLAQSRIEDLIHRSYYHQLQTELLQWTKQEKPSVLDAAMLIAKYRYPEMDKENVMHQFELMRRNVWLELNNFLSPLEQINIINGILFNFFKLQGHELTVHEPNHYFLNQTIETRQGNAFTIGILYMALCEMLDVPIFAVDIPSQFVMAYFDHVYSFEDTEERKAIDQLHFFVDPTNGMVYDRNDIIMYLKKNGKMEQYQNMHPIDSRSFIALMLESLADTYGNIGEIEKATEIESLIPLVQMKQED